MNWRSKLTEPDDPLDDPEALDALVADYDARAEMLDEFAASFVRIDLSDVLDGHASRPDPSILRRDDSQCLFYPGQINGIHGDSGVGKGWVALLATVQQLRAGRFVLMLDAEDIPESIVARLRLLGARDDEIAERFVYVRPVDSFGPIAMTRLVGLVEQYSPSLVIVDSLGECFGLDGIDENHDAEVGPWLRRVARKLADLGPAVVLVDHSTKANDNPLHPSGSKRKRAAIGGASYLVTASDPLTAAHGGRLRLQCAKDRHGTYARGEHVADLVMRTDPIIGTRVDLYAPSADPTTAASNTVVAQRITEVLTDHDAPCSIRTLTALLREHNTKAGDRTIRDTVEIMLARKQLAEHTGPRNARLIALPTDQQPTDQQPTDQQPTDQERAK